MFCPRSISWKRLTASYSACKMNGYFHKMNNTEGGSNKNEVPDYIRVIMTTDAHGRKRQLLVPAALDLDTPKRARTIFKNYQLDALEREFQYNPFIDEEKRTMLAKSLGITETQVKVWFQNRRTKARKMD